MLWQCSSLLIQNLKRNWLFCSNFTWAICQSFTRTLESLKIGTLVGFFCPKLKMYELTIYKELCVMIMKNDAKIEDFDEFWTEHSKISKIFTLMGCFWPKYIMSVLKMYRGVMFVGTEYWCIILWKNDLCFQNSPEEFEKLLPEILKVSKLGLWWDSFIQSRKCISLKFT